MIDKGYVWVRWARLGLGEGQVTIRIRLGISSARACSLIAERRCGSHGNRCVNSLCLYVC